MQRHDHVATSAPGVSTTGNIHNNKNVQPLKEMTEKNLKNHRLHSLLGLYDFINVSSELHTHSHGGAPPTQRAAPDASSERSA